ncbi:hypothetical protein [Mycolicibacterium septicum]|uniref:hypothetical protein n=1 Tax=Mycolicibacterium septicum TaxID=98668 RepID=UPI00235FD1C2|nr:hypothetical protein [Mycolicibacterium septicum]
MSENLVESDIDAVEPETDGAATARELCEKGAPRQLSISLRGLATAAVIVVLAAAVGVFAWLYFGAQRNLNAESDAAKSRSRAETVAMDYAINAAAINFGDLAAWKTKLVAGTTPELNDKLTKASTSMEQLLVPLKWTSTARPLAAKVRSQNGASYTVDSFVSVLTKTVQAPNGIEATATYTVTVDSANNWQITDVGGVGSMLGPS